MSTQIRIFTVIAFLLLGGQSGAHLALAPKVEVAPLFTEDDSLLVRTGAIRITRAEFSRYLARLTAFPTKYQRLQPGFDSHFQLVQSVAFHHPRNVHDYIDNVDQLNEHHPLYRFAVRQWVRGQLGVYVRLRQVLAAKPTPDADDHRTAAVLAFYEAGAKTALLEELITATRIEPSISGLKAAAERADPELLGVLANGPPVDDTLTPPEEQRRMRDRWRAFRDNVMRESGVVNHCDRFASPDGTFDAAMIESSGEVVTLADYLVIFGRPSSTMAWPSQRRGNCARMALYLSMGSVVDDLGLLPERVRQDITVSGDLYRMGKSLATAGGSESMSEVRALGRKPEVVLVRDKLLSQPLAPEPVDDGDSPYVDEDWLTSIQWKLARVLAPKHAIHM